MFDFVARWFRTPRIVSEDAADLVARFGSAAYFEARDGSIGPLGYMARVLGKMAERVGLFA